MKILFVIESLRCGGKERRLVELIKGLEKEHDLCLIIMTDEIHYTQIFDMDIKIYMFKRNILKDFRILNKFLAVLNEFDTDIVHFFDNIAVLHFCFICKYKKIPFVNSMISSAPLNIPFFSKLNFINYILFKISETILSNSNAGLVSYNAPLDKSVVIRNGFDFKRLKILKNPSMVKDELAIGKCKVVGMVASFTEKKDYETYISSAELILRRRRDVIFIAIGDGPLLNKMKLKIKPEFISNFKFLGRIENVESVVNIFDVGVLATYSEGISNSILEYMAMSKPVVATNGGGTNEILINNKTGYLIKLKDHSELACKILNLLEDKKLALSIGKNGKKRIQNEFSIEQMVNSTINLYKKLLVK